jgi:predicted negative regulator of RcsB-dependent stress response
VAYDKIGDVLVAQGNLPAALQSYQADLAIAARLAAKDASNAEWQHDLSVSYDRVGDVLAMQGNLAEALQSYRASLAIRERLVAVDASNASWRRDLAVSHGKVGVDDLAWFDAEIAKLGPPAQPEETAQ